MTAHTDLIARLRRGWTTDCLLAADALEALEQQVAALTNERNDLLILLDNWKTSQGVTEDQLAAAQARESKRLKTISDEATAIAFYGDQPPQWMLNLIALPTDDSALLERLAQERERVAQMILNGSFLHTEAPVAIWAREVAAAIRSMT